MLTGLSVDEKKFEESQEIENVTIYEGMCNKDAYITIYIYIIHIYIYMSTHLFFSFIVNLKILED